MPCVLGLGCAVLAACTAAGHDPEGWASYHVLTAGCALTGLLTLACALARDHGARLVLVHVAALPVAIYGEAVLIPDRKDFQEPLQKWPQRRFWKQHPGIIAAPEDGVGPGFSPDADEFGLVFDDMEGAVFDPISEQRPA